MRYTEKWKYHNLINHKIKHKHLQYIKINFNLSHGEANRSLQTICNKPKLHKKPY